MARRSISLETREQWMRKKYSTSAAPPLAAPSPLAPPAYAEYHFRVAEVASLYSISPDKVRKLFQHEPGVVVLGNGGKGCSRQYTALLIPASVLERVHRRLANVELPS